jgi:phosphoribosylanthranilate isomerase
MAKIKICGLFREEDIEYANEARPDYIGFVFAESRRQVSPALAARLRRRLDNGIVPVGVFVNAPLSDITALYREGLFDLVQLHGDEDPAYIERLRDATAGDKRGTSPIIKAVRAGDLRGEDGADYYLFDSGPGGTGKSFDWKLINEAPPRPWFLAGGIGLSNIKAALGRGPFGIDVSSGAETNGVKDRGKMMELTNMVRKGSGL